MRAVGEQLWQPFQPPCAFTGAEATLHLHERPHPRAAYPRAVDQAGLRTRGHHHQHHGVHPEAERWRPGERSSKQKARFQTVYSALFIGNGSEALWGSYFLTLLST